MVEFGLVISGILPNKKSRIKFYTVEKNIIRIQKIPFSPAFFERCFL